MSSRSGGDRVTNKQLYDELTRLRDELPTRSEVRLTVALAVAAGNALAAAILKFTSAGPAVHAALGSALGWF